MIDEKEHTVANRVEIVREYLVICEKGPESWGASVPDLPGCIGVGSMREEAGISIRESIALCLETLRDRGEPIPEPNHASGTVRLEVA